MMHITTSKILKQLKF